MILVAEHAGSQHFSVRRRLELALLALGLLGLLAVAAGLRADERGLGTHEQLGLPPCTFHRLTGYRCPACGMTTAWARLMHGELRQALAASVSGVLSAVLCGVTAMWLLVAAACGFWPRFGRSAAVAASLALAAMLLVEWIIRLLW